MDRLSQPAHDIVFVVFDDVQLLDFAGPLQTFVTAGERRRAAGGKGFAATATFDYRVRLVSRGGGAVRTSSGVVVMTDPLPTRLDETASVIVAGGYGVEAAMADKTLLRWLKRQAKVVRRMCSVCSGAFLLAEAGLLDGRRAVTHWADCDKFRRMYPDILLEPEAIYTEDQGLWTSAGITAGIDLALALIEEDWNAALANAAARWLVVYAKRPGGQSQFSDSLELAARDGDGAFSELHAWIGANLTKELPLSALAEKAGMSERTLSRKYKEAIGIPPASAVRLLRAQHARMLLTSTASSLKTIARQSGFGSVEQMNAALIKVYGAAARLLRETSLRRDCG